VLWGALLVLLAACASTPPEPKYSQPATAEARVSAPDTVTVSIEPGQGVTLNPEETGRVAQKIKSKIDERKASNPRDGAPHTYQVLVHVSRYEKGNAFARFMLAGMGQIHVDGTIFLYQMPEHTLAEQFDLQKTFAWGGIYGASVSVETIEDTFADGVAQAVTGQTASEQKAVATKTKN
jgi:hypothetical protein